MAAGRGQAGVPAAAAPNASESPPEKDAMLVVAAAPREGEEALGEELRHPVTMPSCAMALSTQAMGIAQEAKDCPMNDAAPLLLLLLPLLLAVGAPPLVQVK